MNAITSLLCSALPVHNVSRFLYVYSNSHSNNTHPVRPHTVHSMATPHHARTRGRPGRRGRPGSRGGARDSLEPRRSPAPAQATPNISPSSGDRSTEIFSICRRQSPAAAGLRPHAGSGGGHGVGGSQESGRSGGDSLGSGGSGVDSSGSGVGA